MNRKKKINQTLKAKAKKANGKFHSNGKPKYIAKADRVTQTEQSADNAAASEVDTTSTLAPQ